MDDLLENLKEALHDCVSNAIDQGGIDPRKLALVIGYELEGEVEAMLDERLPKLIEEVIDSVTSKMQDAQPDRDIPS
jgi:hypothetical protein